MQIKCIANTFHGISYTLPTHHTHTTHNTTAICVIWVYTSFESKYDFVCVPMISNYCFTVHNHGMSKMCATSYFMIICVVRACKDTTRCVNIQVSAVSMMYSVFDSTFKKNKRSCPNHFKLYFDMTHYELKHFPPHLKFICWCVISDTRQWPAQMSLFSGTVFVRLTQLHHDLSEISATHKCTRRYMNVSDEC